MNGNKKKKEKTQQQIKLHSSNRERSDFRPNQRVKHILYLISSLVLRQCGRLSLLLNRFASSESWATYFTDYSVGHHTLYAEDGME